jgi:mRNA interferase MazF
MIDPKRGEVWRANLEPTEGAEIGKIRPVVVVNQSAIGRLPLRVVVPVTDWKPAYAAYPWMTFLESGESSGLRKDSAADAFQVCSLSLIRFREKLGELTDEETDAIAAAVALTVGYRP